MLSSRKIDFPNHAVFWIAAGNRALANHSLPAQQTRHKDTKCVQLHRLGVGMKVSATLEGQKDNFFYRTKVFSKCQQHHLSLSCMHARNDDAAVTITTKIRLEFNQVAIKRNRSMASQRVNAPTHLNNEGKPTSLLDPAFTNAPHLLELQHRLCLH